jgi:hypothetical protein
VTIKAAALNKKAVLGQHNIFQLFWPKDLSTVSHPNFHSNLLV